MANLLITQGCTGTYSIIDVLGDHFNFGRGHGKINHHCRNPNMDPDRQISFAKSKLVYVFCNPYDYTISSFTRSEEFNRVHNAADQCDADYNYFNERKGQTLREYLEDPYDAFKYEEHARGYLENPERKYELLFMKYECLEQHGILPLINFWGVTNVNPASYTFKKRKSDWTSQPDDIKELLEKKYGSTMKWYESLPLYQHFTRP